MILNKLSNWCIVLRILEFLFKGDISNNHSFGPMFRTIINATKVIENHADGINPKTVDKPIAGVCKTVYSLQSLEC